MKCAAWPSLLKTRKALAAALADDDDALPLALLVLEQAAVAAETLAALEMEGLKLEDI